MSEVWTIKRMLEWSSDFLRKAGSESPRLDAQLLLGHLTGLDKVQLYVQFDRPLGTGELATFKTLVKRRAQGEPVAYIIGYKEFYGRRFHVDAGVLVPRPETEHLVDAVIAWVKDQGAEALRIADVGTGSGAIGVTLAAEIEGAVVLGIDLSSDALTVAARNADAHGVRERVKLAKGDVLGPIQTEGSVDVVVSNPPYLDDGLMATLAPGVANFEPGMALYGGPDGLDVHRRLIVEGARVLRAGGLMIGEVAGREQADALAALWKASGHFREVAVGEDYAGKGRWVRGLRT